MKKMIFVTLAGLILGGFTASAQAIQFGQMGYGGTGCPVEKQPLLQINDGEGKVLFADLTLNSKTLLIDRRACNIRLPISLEAGYQVGVKILNVKGSVAQAKNVSASVAAQVSLVGSTDAQAINKAWTAKVNARYEAASTVTGDYAWSSCNGRDAILAISSSVISNRKKVSAASQISVDELTFDFAVRRCLE